MEDEAKLAECASALADALGAALGPYVIAAVGHRHGTPLPDAVRSDAEAAANEATRHVAPQIRKLLNADIDAQTTTPLALARQVVPLATAVLDRAGVAPVQRDPHAKRLHPDDRYDLTPGTFADFGPAVHEPGMAWGAAKAYVHLQRRKAQGRR